MFVIPIAIICFKMHEKKQKEKTAVKMPQVASSAALPLLDHLDDDNDRTSCETYPDSLTTHVTSDVSNSTDESDTTSTASETENCSASDFCCISRIMRWRPEESAIRADLGQLRLCPQHHHHHDAKQQPVLQRNQIKRLGKREALIYEILGNQGSNALPFPKIRHH